MMDGFVWIETLLLIPWPIVHVCVYGWLCGVGKKIIDE
jgi:hypothetical protein